MNIQKAFREVKKKYPGIEAILIPFPYETRSLARSVPYGKTIYYNAPLVKKFAFSQSAPKGLLAHELAHKVQDSEMSFFSKARDELNHFFGLVANSEEDRKLERGADIIAIERGFGKELLQAKIEMKTTYDKVRKNPITNYLSIKEVKEMLKSLKKTY